MNTRHLSWHKKLPVAITISLLLLGLLSSTSCTLFIHSESTYTPKVISDGTGGAIAVYEKVKSGNERDFYAQRINPDGKNIWGDNGTPIGSSQSQSYSFPVFDIVGDGTGGAIIAWRDLSQNTTYLSKIDSNGSILWQKQFAYFDQTFLISDDAGGAIIAFDRSAAVDNTNNNKTTILIIRVDSHGNYPWGQQGVMIPRKGYWPNTLTVISDGANGTIAVWDEMESQVGATLQDTSHTWRVTAQRVDAKGNLSWGANGITICTNPENVTIEEPYATADGSGGAIVGWHQYPSGLTDSSSPGWSMQDICAQKTDINGNILWQPSGVPLQIVKTAEEASPHTPLVVSDGSGGVIIMWEDLRNGLASIYAQKMDSGGAAEWQIGGVKVCYVQSNSSLVWRQIAGDGSGGAVISCSFTDNPGVLVQKLNSAGSTVWPNNGVEVTGSKTTRYFLASDDQGGALVSWGTGYGSSEKSYLQRIGSNGKLLWGTKGIKLGD
jgi:hypothetical protein